MNNDTETNRLEDQIKALEGPKTLQLAQTGCNATLDDEGIIHVLNPDGNQVYALKSDQIPFQPEPLLVTLNLWFMAFQNGRTSMQNEIKTKLLEALKIVL